MSDMIPGIGINLLGKTCHDLDLVLLADFRPQSVHHLAGKDTPRRTLSIVD